MTRFGMGEDGFCLLAELMNDVISNGSSVADRVKELRRQYCELQFCFREGAYDDLTQQLHKLL
jgi:aminomethyltransferase